MKHILLIIAFLLTAQSAQASTLAKAPNNLGLVGYWPMNDARGTRAGDASGQGNHGTLTNGPTWSAAKLGYGLTFDGVNDYVSLPSTIDGAAVLTLAVWAKWTSTTGGVVNNIIQLGTQTVDIQIAQGYNDAGKICIGRGNGVASFTASCDLGSGLNDGRWHHIVYTTTGGAYIDGVATSGGTGVGVLVSSFNSIGGQGHYGNFSGSIDDVRIYNRALGVAEVARLYAAGQSKSTASNSNGLVAHWSFTDCKGLRTTDFSGQGNHGTLTGGPTWGTGRLGCGVTLDGTNDYVSIPDAPEWDSSDISGSLWVKFNILQDSMFLKHQTGGFEFDWQTSNFLVWSANGGAVNALVSWTPVVGTWYHLAFVRNGVTNVTTIYVNGVSIGSGTHSTDTGSSSGVLSIGQSLGTFFLNGSLDDVRIYNRALSAAEVSSLYASGVAGVDPGVAKVNSTQKNLLTNGLVGYWGFNGADTIWSSDTAGTTRDLSGQGNTGTLTNMSQRTSPAAGKSGQALSFDGVNDYVTVAHSASLTLTTNLTVSLWIKDTSLSSDKVLLAKSSTSGADRTFWFFENGHIRWSYFNTLGPIIPSASITDGAWHHVVGTFDGTTLVAYLDGVQTGTPTAATPIADNSAAIGINSYVGGTNLAGEKSLDEVRIYNRALSAAEVKELYNLAR